MGDYSQTPSAVLASAYAERFIPTPAFVLLGNPPAPFPNVCIAGATLAAGMPVYQSPDDGKFYKAEADGVSPLYKVVGIAENGAYAGQPVSIVVRDPYFTPGCAMLVGDTLIVSDTAGMIAHDADKSSGWKVSTLGVAFSTTQMDLNITRSDVAKV